MKIYMVSLFHRATINEETKNKKTEMLRRNGPVERSVELVLRLEGSLWRERFVKEVGLEPGVNERGSYGLDGESGELTE